MRIRHAAIALLLATPACKKTAPTPTAATLAVAATPAPKRAIDGGIAKPTKLDREEQRRFRAAMAEGHKADRAGDHATAVAAFARALALQPDDAGGLSELGWSAFLGGDLERADRATRRAVAAATNRRQKAASLYNLGRVQEKRGQNPAAISSYVESLDLRASRTVREQLAKLDPDAAAAADPLQPDAMEGPFPSLEAFCDSLDGDNRSRERCPAPDNVHGAIAKPPAPYREVRYLLEADDMTCYLAVRLAAGWYVDRKGFFCREAGHLEHTIEQFAVEDLLPGGTKEVVLRTMNERLDRDRFEIDDGDDATHMASTLITTGCDGHEVLCGIGSTGAPSCVGFDYAEGTDCGGGVALWAWELKATFTRDGQLDLRAVGKPTADAKAVTGKRPFSF